MSGVSDKKVTSLSGNLLKCKTFKSTPPKTNMEPENHPLEGKSSEPNLHFWLPLGRPPSPSAKLSFTRLAGIYNLVKLACDLEPGAISGKSRLVK